MIPLKGIRVLDLTWVLSGPFATRMLADHGAEVIKIQSLVTSKTSDKNDDPYFCTWNRNKRSICLDMRKSEARELFFELVRISDVVIDNFSPHVMRRWGFTYESLKAVNSRIIQVQISAGGQSETGEGLSGFGPGIQSMTGLTAATSYTPDAPKGIGFAYADHVMGLYASMEVLAAIRNRKKTGQGAYIDISGTAAARSVYDIKKPKYAFSVLCDDGKWCAVSPEDEKQLETAKMITPGWSSELFVFRMQDKGIPAHVVYDSNDLFSDIHLKKRHCFETIPREGTGSMLVDRCPVRTIPDEPPVSKPAPQMGEANEYVFRELLSLDEDTFDRYLKTGVIA